MSNFVIGVLSSLTATFIVWALIKRAWPNFQDKCLYNGVRVDGSWEIFETRDEKQVKVGRLELKQIGRRIFGSSVRSKTRNGNESHRKFTYEGCIYGHQVTLLFEDEKGVGFDAGSYVFIVQNDGKTMVGNSTFHGKLENRIISESRTLKKVLS